MTEAEEELEDLEDQDLVETVTKMINGCEAFVTAGCTGMKIEIREQYEKSVAEMEEKLKERDSQIDQLFKRINKMEEQMNSQAEEIERVKSRQVCSCKCKELFCGFVTVGNAVFSGAQTLVYVDDATNQQNTTGGIQGAAELESTLDQSTTLSSFTSSTPIEVASSSCDNQPRVIVEPLPSYTSQLCKLPVYTSVQTLDELPEILRRGLEEFYAPRSPAVTNEKLTDLQRAYVLYIRNKPENSGLNPSALAKKCLDMGITDRIWTPTFKPPGVQDFYKYLHQRMRNLQSQSRMGKLQSLAATQAKRLSEMCGPSKKAKLG
ncbi:MAG: hypothetical protein N0E59_20290 [Candidatus Thiodiazotropha taylori]|nr:hypothetical protein [Candidatus Thiodiazotropha taylori]MCG8113099.1 hypothetical protein [Candidatus Thiodiazotropha taylori]MCW4247411.1 hypothetical protein [Candidatus Thiodiazotropha endolucinida]MCW4285458.1 hypothetical protein [Candidatus Thiodiazotropha taylori]